MSHVTGARINKHIKGSSYLQNIKILSKNMADEYA